MSRRKIEPKRTGEHHSFCVEVACVVGERKAILLKEIYGWCLNNLDNDRNVFSGIPWSYNSAKAFSEKFRYWNEKSISRWLKELQDDGWICSTDIFNKFRRDRTKWFTINIERYEAAIIGHETSISQNEKWKSQIEECISQNEGCKSQNEKSTFLKMRNDISQNEGTLPSSTHLVTSSTSSSKLTITGKSEIENENLGKTETILEAGFIDFSNPEEEEAAAPKEELWVTVAKETKELIETDDIAAGTYQMQEVMAGVTNETRPRIDLLAVCLKYWAHQAGKNPERLYSPQIWVKDMSWAVQFYRIEAQKAIQQEKRQAEIEARKETRRNGSGRGNQGGGGRGGSYQATESIAEGIF